MYFYGFYLKKWLIYEVSLCLRRDISRVKKRFCPFVCVSSRKLISSWWKLLIVFLLTGREWQDNIGTRCWSEWGKCVINIGEWLWHLNEYCPLFWSCLQFILIGRCWKFSWSIIMDYSSFSDISRSKTWVSSIFVFWIQIQKEEI